MNEKLFFNFIKLFNLRYLQIVYTLAKYLNLVAIDYLF